MGKLGNLRAATVISKTFGSADRYAKPRATTLIKRGSKLMSRLYSTEDSLTLILLLENQSTLFAQMAA
jgi:hypothetical protein